MLLRTRGAGASLLLTFCFSAGVVQALPSRPVVAAQCATPAMGESAVLATSHAGFVAVAPQRLADTRSALGAPLGPLAAHCVLRVSLDTATTPVGAIAAVLTVTSAEAPRSTYVTVYPCGNPLPSVSHLNPRPGDPVPGLVIVPVDATREACIYVDDETQIIVDVTGWYAPAGAVLHEMTPTRVLDTRTAPRPAGLPRGRPADGAVVRLPLAGVVLPPEARAVTAVVTMTNATQSTFATASPCGSVPPTSTVNTLAGVDRGAPAMVGLDSAGALCVFVERSSDLVVDITGWFGDDGTTSSLPLETPGSPLRDIVARRLADSRNGIGGWSTPFASGEVRSLSLLNDVAVGVTAVQLEVIATDATSSGFLTAYPCGTATPNASVVNFRSGSLIAESSMVTVGLGAGGRVCIASNGSAHVIVDLIAVHGTTSGLRALATSPGLDRLPMPGQPDHTVHCPAGGGPVRIVAMASPGATVSVAGGAPAPAVDTTVTMAVDAVATIDSSGPSGTEHAFLRCLPADFPTLIATGVSPTPGWYRATSMTPTPFAFILDEFGVPVWYKRTPYPVIGLYADGPNGVAWRKWTGGGFPVEAAKLGVERHALDGSLTGTVTLPTEAVDWHEYRRLPNGNRLVVVYSREALPPGETRSCNDPSSPPVPVAATVLVNGDIVELDPAGTEIWRWHSSEHVADSENTMPQCFDLDPGTGVEWGLDLEHINAIDVFPDGDLLVTARHLNAVLRVDRNSGAVEWKLGGAPPQEGIGLTILDDPRGGPVAPHDGRVLPNGNITMHDNRTGAAQSSSRAVEYSLQGSTATLVWSHAATFSAGTLGSTRRLDDGSTIIGWGTGQAPWFEQVLADGSPALTIGLSGGVNIYRAEPSVAAEFDRALLRAMAGGPAAQPAPNS